MQKVETAGDCAGQVEAELKSSWLPHIYRERIRKLRTRSYEFEKLKAAARVEIQHTLLGVELKIGKRRLLCPDLATARYLAVFARAGCERVAIPYDITKVPHLYRERIRKLRTRSYEFEKLKSGARVEIQHTLLGVELKVGKRRRLCPDL